MIINEQGRLVAMRCRVDMKIACIDLYQNRDGIYCKLCVLIRNRGGDASVKVGVLINIEGGAPI